MSCTQEGQVNILAAPERSAPQGLGDTGRWWRRAAKAGEKKEKQGKKMDEQPEATVRQKRWRDIFFLPITCLRQAPPESQLTSQQSVISILMSGCDLIRDYGKSERD